MHCIYRQTEVKNKHEKHVRQFRESSDGTQAEIFPAGRAIIKLHDDGNRYEVRTVHGELFSVGTGGFDEAKSRIQFAEPAALISVNSGGTHRMESDHMAHVAPTIFRMAYTQQKDSGYLFVAMDGSRNGVNTGAWQFAGGNEAIVGDEIERTILDAMAGESNFVVKFAHRPLEMLAGLGRQDMRLPKQDFTELRKTVQKLRITIEKGADA